MPYLSPGVYVEEVPSAIKPIAGVSTSTAGFIGIFPDSIPMPPAGAVKGEAVGTGQEEGEGDKKKLKTSFELQNNLVVTDAGTFQIQVAGKPKGNARLENEDGKKSRVIFDEKDPPAKDAAITADYLKAAGPFKPMAAGQVKLCTNFTEYKNAFG